MNLPDEAVATLAIGSVQDRMLILLDIEKPREQETTNIPVSSLRAQRGNPERWHSYMDRHGLQPRDDYKRYFCNFHIPKTVRRYQLFLAADRRMASLISAIDRSMAASSRSSSSESSQPA